jgi:hypothetical protein
MKNKIVILFLLIFASILVGVSSRSADTGSVTATVTAQNISISVSDGSVSYGTLAINTTEDTTSGGVNDSQTATNEGNVTENFNIMGSDTGSWTLAATQGSDEYFHKFCNNGTCDSSANWTALTTSYQTLATGVASSGTQEFDLQIGVPSSTAVFTEQNADVTVQAVIGS